MTRKYTVPLFLTVKIAIKLTGTFSSKASNLYFQKAMTFQNQNQNELHLNIQRICFGDRSFHSTDRM